MQIFATLQNVSTHIKKMSMRHYEATLKTFTFVIRFCTCWTSCLCHICNPHISILGWIFFYTWQSWQSNNLPTSPSQSHQFFYPQVHPTTLFFFFFFYIRFSQTTKHHLGPLNTKHNLGPLNTKHHLGPLNAKHHVGQFSNKTSSRAVQWQTPSKSRREPRG